MPLVLPPTVLGFYLLILLSPSGSLGGWLDQHLGLRLIFSFPGLVFSSVIYRLPFMVQPVQSGLARLPPSLRHAALTLGKSRWTLLSRGLRHNIKPSLLTDIILFFANTIRKIP